MTGSGESAISWEFALCGKKSDTSWVPCWGGGDQEQDTRAGLGRVVVAHGPGNANVIANPFYLLKVTQS